MDASEDHRDQAVYTVTQVARKLGLSRARFYQLLRKEVFPQPVYGRTNRQPMYTEQLQEVCLKVRKTGIGINGLFVRFYERRKIKKPSDEHQKTTAILRGMGLVVTAAQVRQAFACLKLSRKGNQQGDAEVIRTLFKYFHGTRQNDV